MPNEHQMWGDHVRPALASAKMDPVRVENRVHPGTPDVNFMEGWLELKSVKTWPKRGGVLAIDHFTPQQRVWLLRRWKGGGNVWLMLRVGRDWWGIFDGETAAVHVGRADREKLESEALFWGTTFDFRFVAILRSGREI